MSSNSVVLDSAHTVKTAPSGNEEFSFVAFADVGIGNADQIALATMLESLSFDLAVLPGDIVYWNGEAENYDPYYFSVYRNVLKETPFYPALGNHDVNTASGQPFFDAHYLPTNSRENNERYYGFEYGNALFVALDTNGLDTAQVNWCQEILRSTGKRWKIVYFHVPLFSSGATHGSDLSVRSTLQSMFESEHVDLVLNGHDHDYERSIPMNDVVYVVTGGGNGLSSIASRKNSWTAYAKSVFHVTMVTIESDTLTLMAIDADGNVFDSFEIVKGETLSGGLLKVGGNSYHNLDSLGLSFSVSSSEDSANVVVYKRNRAPLGNRTISSPLAVVSSKYYWEMSSSFSSATWALTFRYTPALDGINDESILSIATRKRNADGWSRYSGTITLDAGGDSISASGVSSLSQWIIGSTSAANPLPVQLSFLTGHLAGNDVVLEWSTATETSNYGFEVERSFFDSESAWQVVGFVAGWGTTSTPKSYAYRDPNVVRSLSGRFVSYRLRQIGSDGTFEFSNLVHLVLGNPYNKFRVLGNSPNPSARSSTLTFAVPDGGRVNLELTDILGRRVHTKELSYTTMGTYEMDIPYSNLSSGTYIYRIEYTPFDPSAASAVKTGRILVMK